MLSLITGSHPRHMFLADKLIDTGLVNCWVIEKRETFLPDSDFIQNQELRFLFDLHFKKREESEMYWFGNTHNSPSDVKSLMVDENEQNSDKVKHFLKENSSDTLISYGCHILDQDVISLSTHNSINIHGGLSPWYKGIITHFWPSYNLEPELTGMTFHMLTKKIDAGSIVHQTKADLVSGDGLHMLAGRVVDKFIKELKEIVPKIIENQKPLIGVDQKTNGRLWLGKMWRPEHLLLIYKHFEDRIVDFCLENSISSNIKEQDLIYFDS